MTGWRVLCVVALASAAAGASQATQGQASQGHDHALMNARGREGMGFDQETTTHHFYLYPDGGAIDVSVKVASDAENLMAIRRHLSHIATLFGQGNFSIPHFVHDTAVPGTADLARLSSKITWRYVEAPRGGRVEATAADGDALAALHAFLRFQITDHRTGDSLDVSNR
jgi:hypothetical protein